MKSELEMNAVEQSSIYKEDIEIEEVDEPNELLAYLNREELPCNWKEVRKLIQKATRYILIEGKLYWRSYPGPYLKCLWKVDALKILA